MGSLDVRVVVTSRAGLHCAAECDAEHIEPPRKQQLQVNTHLAGQHGFLHVALTQCSAVIGWSTACHPVLMLAEDRSMMPACGLQREHWRASNDLE